MRQLVLMAALSVTVVWLRSRTIEDVFEFSISRQPMAVVSILGRVEDFWFLDYATHSVEPSPNLPAFPLSSRVIPETEDFGFAYPDVRWQLEWHGQYDSKSGLELKQSAVGYSFVAIPFTLLLGLLDPLAGQAVA